MRRRWSIGDVLSTRATLLADAEEHRHIPMVAVNWGVQKPDQRCVIEVGSEVRLAWLGAAF